MDNEAVKAIIDLADRGHPAVILEVTEPTIRAEPIPLLERPDVEGSVEVRSIKELLDEWRTAPERRKGSAKVNTLTAFIDLVNRHKDTDSVVFGDLTDKAPSIMAVIDYHTIAHDPRFGQHRVHYAFPLSKEWLAWLAMDGKVMSQGEWAAFVEERIADLASPLDAEASEYERLFQTKIAVPSELIQLSRGMQISVAATVKDVRTLQSGEVEISYAEVHNDGSGQKLIVPGLFIIQIPMFVDGDRVRIISRLRYRRQDSKIVWFYQMYRADLVMRARLVEDVELVMTATALPFYEGAPET